MKLNLTLNKAGKALIVRFDYDSEIIAKLKATKSAEWKDKQGYWLLTPTEKALEFLNGCELQLDAKTTKKLVEWYEKLVVKQQNRPKRKALAHAVSSPVIPDILEQCHFVDIDNNPCQPRAYQWTAVHYALANKGNMLLLDLMGLGKLQPVDSKVLTPSGWQEIGTLKLGDKVIGSDGKPKNVLRIFPQGKKPIYRVNFSDNSSVEAGDDHLWTVLRLYKNEGRVEQTSFVLTTKQLRERPVIDTCIRRRRKVDLSKTILYIPTLSAPVEFEQELSLPIPPYTTGQLIANGYLGGIANKSCSVSLSVNSLDAKEIEARLITENIKFRLSGVYGGATRFNIRGLDEFITDLNLNVLSRQKHIPSGYKHAKVVDRIALLQGLMDGDGSISITKNKLVYHTISEQLAKDVQELVEGLGGISDIHSYDRTLENKPIEYRVRMRLPEWVIPFSTNRKLSRYNPGRLARPCRTVRSVEYSREAEAVCIQVDAEDSLYTTEHCILTHNTSASIMVTLHKQYKKYPVLIVCSPSLIGNWENELEKMFHIKPTLIDKPLVKLDPNVRFYIVSDFQLHKVPKADWFVIIDECHRFKNRDTVRYRSLQKILNCKKCIIGLTGTPIPNRPKEVFPPMTWVDPEFSKWWDFALEFCDAKKGYFGWDTNGASNLDVLHELLFSDFAVRRETADVALQLPDKIRQVVNLSPNKKVVSETVVGVFAESARQKCVDKEFLESVTEILDSLKKVVIFFHHKVMGDALEALCKQLGKKLIRIDGSIDPTKRFPLVEQFQNDPDTGVALCSITAASEGLNMQKGECVLFAELYHVPAKILQSEFRVHRPGCKNTVLCLYLLWGKCEKDIHRMILHKQGISEKVLSGKRLEMDDDSIIKELAKEWGCSPGVVKKK